MPLAIDTIATHPSFLPSLADYGEALAGVYHENQRLGVNLASQRKWLISQMAMALYWGGEDGLTVNGLIDVLSVYNVASPNTIRAFMEESFKYGFLRVDPASRRLRPRYWQPTEIVIGALAVWMTLNLQLLDRIDGQNRAQVLTEKPELLFALQPPLARACLHDVGWREPPKRLALLQNTISGGMVMDHIVSQIGDKLPSGDHYLIAPINARRLSEQMFISRTHLQRILHKAAEIGVLGWQVRPFEGEMSVDRSFISEYCRWQAVKSHHLDVVFQAVGRSR
ncbi:hypothetical protein [Martelella limonii]|uniref:hypothetical protein n=1 Tax=Martelella limonii TaxID=1647649 RepID=UPI0015812A5C|nr:hypothetical protein [Martelella limonii]